MRLPKRCREFQSHLGRQCLRTTTVRPPPPEAIGQVLFPEHMAQMLAEAGHTGPWPLRMPRSFDEEDLFERYIQIGADGSVILEKDVVYGLSVPIRDRLLTIDYFHGVYPDYGGVMAVFEEPAYHHHRHHLARNMIATSRCGYVVRRLIKIQGLFRERARERVREQARKFERNVRRRLKCTSSGAMSETLALVW